MTPNEILAAAKKRVKNSSSALDWNLFFETTINRIFGGERTFRFARQELNFVASSLLADYTFDSTPTELALRRIECMRCTTNYALVGGVPEPLGNTGYEVLYRPLTTFRSLYPDNTDPGDVVHWTIVGAPDGTNGMHIALGPLPSDDTAIFIDGDFRPAYTIDDNQLPILPRDYHWLMIDGIASIAAEETGKNFLSVKLEKRFLAGIADLEAWDRKNLAYKPRMNPGGITDPRSPQPFRLPMKFDRRYR